MLLNLVYIQEPSIKHKDGRSPLCLTYVKSPSPMTTKSRVGWRLCTENDTTQIWTDDLRIITYREDERMVERYLHLQAAIDDGFYKLIKGVWYNKSLKLEYVE